MPSLPEHLRPLPAGRQKLSRDVMEEHQRARVLEVAIAVFAEKGYPSTTIDDLVNAARVGVGSFYTLFGGKEECLVAAYELVTREVRAEVVSAAASAPTWGARVVAGLRILLNWIQKEPARARVALIEIQTGGQAALRSYEETLDAVADFLSQGREITDHEEQLPATLEQTTVNGIAWLLHRRLSTAEADSLDPLFRELGVLILEPYLGDKRAQEELAANAAALSA